MHRDKANQKRVLFVGIGAAVNATQLNVIASQPTSSHVLLLSASQATSFVNVTNLAMATSCNTTSASQKKVARRSAADPSSSALSSNTYFAVAALAGGCALLVAVVVAVMRRHATSTTSQLPL